jgi:protein-L-isoaspartate(D-aspartate) O-methyltransferase
MDGGSFDERRDAMVREQIARRGVSDPRVLEAMRAVPRERFVPPARADQAYADRAVSIGLGQTISQPYMVAVMTEALRVSPGDRVLEIGTGSGYQSAVLAALGAHVISVERHEALADLARQRLAALGVTSVTVVVGDGTEGHAAGAPYQAILVTAGAPHVPAALREQLVDGGRLVIPVGPAAHQELLVIQRDGDRYTESAREGCVFVPLIGRDGWKG